MNKILPLALLAFSCAAVFPQSASLPRVPALNKANFTLTFVSKTPPPEPGSTGKNFPKTPASISITRYGDTQRNLITWSDSSQTETYFIDNLLVAQNPAGNWINIFNIDTDFIDSMYDLTFPGAFSWIGPATFVKLDQYGDNPANLFQKGRSGADAREKIWCDPQSGLPVVWTDGDKTCRFEFFPPPMSAPELPENFKKEVDRYRLIATIPKQISNRP